MYDGLCRELPEDEVKKRLEAGEKFTIRLKMSKTGDSVFNDLIRGEVKIKNETVDDQILIKSDGFPTYHFAVVVDDHLMDISHVIRGEEWISSTPKYLELYKVFDWKAPAFAHLPLLLNTDKSKLSKRQGDVAVEDYLKKGYLPEALINFVAFLGWNPGDEREMFSLQELIQNFSLEKVGKSGSVFNLEKFNWYNREYLKNISNERIVELSERFFSDYFKKEIDKEFLIKAVSLEKERINVLSELPEACSFLFNLPEYDKNILAWKKSDLETGQKILKDIYTLLLDTSENEWFKDKLEEKILKWIKDKAYGNGDVLWPLRVSLSGQQNSPGPFEIAEVLGKEESLRRILSAVEK
jgi:glutamyl-tRNA synthetase